MSMNLISYCGALTRRLVRVSCLGELKVKVRPKPVKFKNHIKVGDQC